MPVLIFAAITGVIAALQYFTEAAVASGVASGKTGVGSQNLALVVGYPDKSLLTYPPNGCYDRGFGSSSSATRQRSPCCCSSSPRVFIGALLRRFNAFSTEAQS